VMYVCMCARVIVQLGSALRLDGIGVRWSKAPWTPPSGLLWTPATTTYSYRRLSALTHSK
jgi:hypothetical protein